MCFHLFKVDIHDPWMHGVRIRASGVLEHVGQCEI